MSSRLERDNSTPEGKRIWEAVEIAASRAPQNESSPSQAVQIVSTESNRQADSQQTDSQSE